MKIRAALPDDADDIARVHCCSWNESYRGLLDDDVIDRRTLDVRARQWRESLIQEHRVTLVAVDSESGIVGFSSALILVPPVDGYDAYLQTLYLLAAVKAQGLGKELLVALAALLAQRGCANLVLRVVRKNVIARRFYEHLGARLQPCDINIDADMFDDVIYAFDEIASLLSQAKHSVSPIRGRADAW